MPDGQPLRTQFFNQREYFIDGFEDRPVIEQLRSDMATYTLGRETRKLLSFLIEILHLGDVSAKLVLAQTGGDVRMRYCIDIRVHAQRNRSGPPEARGNLRNEIKFRLRLAIKAVNALLERIAHLLCRFAYA